MKSSQALVLLSFVVLSSGCDVFQTTDAEGTRGRGAKAFDPYSSSASGAISLSLLSFNGCAILPNGEPVTKGSLTLPGYPDTCPRLNSGIPTMPEEAPSFEEEEPTARLTVTPGSLYFLREFTMMDAVLNRHTAFEDRKTPATWIRKQSRFKSLDWSGMTVGRDDWKPMGEEVFQRETFFENAAWMMSDDDTLKLEVLDAEGIVRATETYSRRDFLAENSTTGRTRVSWTIYNLSRPLFPGDPVMHPAGDPFYHTGVKVSFANSTNPFKSFRMPQLTGEGVIRVTWSLMEKEPFHFPVTFVPEQDRTATCYKLGADGLATEERVPCGFGLTQKALINTPRNGKYYMPGEALDFIVSLQDGEGHGLHSRDLLPSFSDFRNETSNGIAYFNEWMLLTYRDSSSSESGFKVVGPLQELTTSFGTYQTPFFAYPQLSEPKFYVDPGMSDVVPGYAEAGQPTRYNVPLPADAKPGTYALLLKGHRSFMGERLNRLEPIFFQVGQEQPTTYPGNVGNCQICHNGVNSLVNLHHGMSVDHVESCKGCHYEAGVGHTSDMVHRIHIGSRKYKQNKGDCTVCHLTRQSAVRASLVSCQGCHVDIHGSEFFDLKFESMQNTPNGYGNCANACHTVAPPSEHILPSH
ncbi:hypothetical protein NR798_12685 [Archangium gephyra]|uniref:hypothetical protein n=1 Tax=Archangium gephyra TaxID=48 RepID=UPI0035D4360E